MEAKLRMIVGTKTGPNIDWLNPIAMSQLKVAVKNEAKSVVLDEREFNITYGHMFNLSSSNEKRECVKLQRADGAFVPFGYVSLAKIRRFRFDDDE